MVDAGGSGGKVGLVFLWLMRVGWGKVGLVFLWVVLGGLRKKDVVCTSLRHHAQIYTLYLCCI